MGTAQCSRSCLHALDKTDNIVLGVSDEAFKKEEDEATAMRGCVVIRADASSLSLLGGDGVRASRYHVLVYASKKQRHVTRSTFAAELFGRCDTIGTMLAVILALQEVEIGTVTIEQARRLREYGPYHYATIICVDAMSVVGGSAA